MKKFFSIGLLCILFVFVIRQSIYKKYPSTIHETRVIPEEVDRKKSVTVVLDFGNTIATYSGVNASTAFDALENVTKENNIELEKKQYDFGVFVEQIGINKNTQSLAWIYFINGTSASMAADKQPVGNNDVILWQYTKPIF